MFLSSLTLFVALSLSVIAAYYSIAGLAAIFAAAAIPIIIMGSVLEAAKIVATVWLHEYWNQCRALMKLYLVPAVVMLMLITSMGIFGFLSKAHIEQTSAGEESVAQVERLTTEIVRQQDVVDRAEEKIRQLQTSGTGSDANVQAQIDKEQQRIDNAYARIQPAIDEQNKIIGSQAKLYQDELDRIDTGLKTLQGYIDSGDTKKAQQMIGASADGVFGKKTAEKIGDWQTAKQEERKALLTKIEQATNNPQARAAGAEIKRLRLSAEREVAESNKLINRLRTQVGKADKTADIDAQVDEQNLRIKTANTEIDTLTEEKYKLEGEYRKLEAEVGPIKYIAEFIYGESADKNMLEKAVTWVIILIIFVFDPLAIMMLLAATESLKWAREKKTSLPSPMAPRVDPELGEDLDDEMASDITELENDDPIACYKCGTALLNAPGIGPFCPNKECDVADGPFINKSEAPHHPDTHPYLKAGFGGSLGDLKPMVAPVPAPEYEQDDGPLTEEQIEQIKRTVDELEEVKKTAEIIEEEQHVEEIANIGITEPEEVVPEVQETIPVVEDVMVEDDDDMHGMDANEKEAARRWKTAYPDRTLKFYRRLVETGKATELPWMAPQYYYKLSPDSELGNETQSGFGIAFPSNPNKGDSFLRVDRLPSVLYKYNGTNWIEVDKALNDRYAHDEAYIDHLIVKIDSGEYDPELLSDAERDQIEQRLTGN
jgi:predicted Fe-S protein YdhL (DUF1289 family)